MKPVHLMILPVISAILALGCSRAGEAQKSSYQLGKLDFSANGDPRAQPAFERGMLLLHSFEYDDARAAFLEAQAIDSGFVMAVWGEAMTHNHPLWRQQAYEKGRAVLTKLGASSEARLSKIENDLEKGLWQGAEILYGEGSKQERDQAYSNHLEQLYRQHPNSQEIGAFYALSLLGSVAVGRDESIYEKGARVAKGIIEENPNHPGALHYLIHAYDDPGHARFALAAADSYSQVAPDAAHALHMPSHIYVAMGMWEEVVSSNIASWEASVQRMDRKNLDNDARSYHALSWLMYGLLQQGRFGEAKQLLFDMKQFAEEKPSKRARDYLVAMKGNFLVESGDWNSELATVTMDRSDLNISTRAAFHYLEGYRAFLDKDNNKVDSILAVMKEERRLAGNVMTDEGTPMCSAGSNRYTPNQLDIDQAHVMEMELEGLSAQLNNDPETTEKWLSEAAQLERRISYAYGPPTIVQPSYELYGTWLLEQGRAEEAAIQYEQALEKGPNRIRAVAGKLEAALVMGKQEEVELLQKKLEDLLAKADEPVKRKFLKQQNPKI